MEELDYLGIFGEFNRRRIKYLVCGGLAVNLWGIPRMTYDIDLLLEMREINLKKFLSLMETWEFKPRLPVAMTDLLDEKKREVWVKEKNLKAFTLYNPRWAISEIDVLIGTSISYSEVSENVVRKSVGRVKIPLVSLEDLVRMKRDTGRDQDEADVVYLKRLLEKEIE